MVPPPPRQSGGILSNLAGKAKLKAAEDEFLKNAIVAEVRPWHTECRSPGPCLGASLVYSRLPVEAACRIWWSPLAGPFTVFD